MNCCNVIMAYLTHYHDELNNVRVHRMLRLLKTWFVCSDTNEISRRAHRRILINLTSVTVGQNWSSVHHTKKHVSWHKSSCELFITSQHISGKCWKSFRERNRNRRGHMVLLSNVMFGSRKKWRWLRRQGRGGEVGLLFPDVRFYCCTVYKQKCILPLVLRWFQVLS